MAIIKTGGIGPAAKEPPADGAATLRRCSRTSEWALSMRLYYGGKFGAPQGQVLWRNCCFVPGISQKRSELAGEDGLPHAPHQIQEMADIVQGRERRKQNFSGLKQMPEIRPREGTAGITAAGGVKRRVVVHILRLLDGDFAL